MTVDGLANVENNVASVCLSSYPQQQFSQQGNQGQFGSMMMNGSMGTPGPVSGAGGQMGQMQGQMGMNSMGMGRMPMGTDQVTYRSD